MIVAVIVIVAVIALVSSPVLRLRYARSIMPWLLLFLSGLVEAGWAIGLKASEGLTRPLPTVLTLIGMLASFALLSLAARSIPVGTAYAVWVGIGTVGAAALGVVLYAEPISLARVGSLALILAGIVGLKLTTPA